MNFKAGFISSYSNSEEAYQIAVKKFNELVSVFENTSFSIPLIKGKIKHIGKYKQDMGDLEKLEFTCASQDERFKNFALIIQLQKTYDIKDKMNSKSWGQFYEVTITVKQ